MHEMAHSTQEQLASAKLIAARARDLLEATGVPEEQVAAFLKDGNLSAISVPRGGGGMRGSSTPRGTRTQFQPQLLSINTRCVLPPLSCRCAHLPSCAPCVPACSGGTRARGDSAAGGSAGAPSPRVRGESVSFDSPATTPVVRTAADTVDPRSFAEFRRGESSAALLRSGGRTARFAAARAAVGAAPTPSPSSRRDSGDDAKPPQRARAQSKPSPDDDA